MPQDPPFGSWLARHVSPKARFRLRALRKGLDMPDWGNLRRTRPFSKRYGSERGVPIDRYYLHRFLEQRRHLISGRVLEIQASDYTRQYGYALIRLDSVDIVNTFNARPTYLVDLAKSEGVIPDDTYDCFLMPNALEALQDIEGCLRNALRVVQPGGVILASCPVFVPLMADSPDYWRMSAEGWRELASRVWPGCEVRIEGHGNCLAAVAALLGLAVEELEPKELDYQDPRYPVLVTVECHKPRRVESP